jgi:hypothetical protein
MLQFVLVAAEMIPRAQGVPDAVALQYEYDLGDPHSAVAF